MRLPRSLKARKLVQALLRDGFLLDRISGSHRIYRHPDGRRVVLTYHRGSQEFPAGTLNAMLMGTRWTEDDLRRLNLLD